MAETELSVPTKQYLDRRVLDMAPLKVEVAAWEKQRNTRQATIDWRFTTDQARIKLRRRYPSISVRRGTIQAGCANAMIASGGRDLRRRTPGRRMRSGGCRAWSE